MTRPPADPAFDADRFDITFGPEVLADFVQGSAREWIETNGRGGWAAGSLSGALMRASHGLLVVGSAESSPRMLLTKLEETAHTGDGRWALDANRYPGAVHPDGHLRLMAFHLLPCPTWTYRVGPHVLKRAVMMLHGENTTLVSYHLASGPGPINLSVRPFLSVRSTSGPERESLEVNLTPQVRPTLLQFQLRPDAPSLWVGHPFARWTPEPLWYHHVLLDREREAGRRAVLDLASPGTLDLELPMGTTVMLTFSTEPRRSHEGALLARRELDRRAALRLAAQEPLAFWLHRSAAGFLVDDAPPSQRGNPARRVQSDYLEADPRIRDGLVALPGLLLAAGQSRPARDALELLARRLSAPVGHPDLDSTPGAPAIWPPDAGLWFLRAARTHLRDSRDTTFARRVVLPAAREVLGRIKHGTAPGLTLAPDGLLILAPTAPANGATTAPDRAGKTVELQALWHDGLHFGSELATWVDGPRKGGEWKRMAAMVRASFQRQFWSTAQSHLVDSILESGPTTTVTAHGLWALAAEDPLLAPERARAALDAIEQALLTPVGLRERPGAVPEAWWIGPFATAYLNVHGRTPAIRDHVRALLRGLTGSLSTGLVGHVDHGAQTTGELLRVLHEELGGSV